MLHLRNEIFNGERKSHILPNAGELIEKIETLQGKLHKPVVGMCSPVVDVTFKKVVMNRLGQLLRNYRMKLREKYILPNLDTPEKMNERPEKYSTIMTQKQWGMRIIISGKQVKP